MTNAIDRELQKWALLIGIKEYPEWGDYYRMKGAVNDVDAIERLLTGERFGFPSENILTLTSPADEKLERPLANRDNILEAFRTHLIENERIMQRDVVVIYYSGHGSWVPDKSRDEDLTTVDGLVLARDETLVPCDSGGDHTRDITDDEIADLLERLTERTRNINLFFDSCHSGTITRLMPEEEEAQVRIRCVPPPPDAQVVPARAGQPVSRVTRSITPSRGSGGWLRLSDDYVVISACHASESAGENRFILGGFKYHGFMTYCLLKALRDVGPETAYYDIWKELQREVSRLNPKQHPQIEGDFERKVFGGTVLPRKRYVEVTEKSDDTISLAAGLVHGATIGSRFAIYREGMETFEDETARVAVVRLTEVDAFTATSALEEGDIAEVKVGAPAVEIEHDYGEMRMAVRVIGDDPALDAVREQVKESRLLILAETDAQPSTATVQLCHPRNADGIEDTSRAKLLRIHSSSDDRPLVKPLAPDGRGPATVRERLDDVAKCLNLLAIRNHAPESKLRGKVKLRLVKVVGQVGLGKDRQEQLEPVEPDEGGNIVLRVGDRVYFKVENQSDQHVYVGIFNWVEPEWQPNILFPPRGAKDNRVLSQKSLTIRPRQRVELPDDHIEAAEGALPLPWDTTKLFATTKWVNLHSFWLSRTRALQEKADLPRLLGLAGGGGPEHATRSMDEGEVEDWTTDELVFRITT